MNQSVMSGFACLTCGHIRPYGFDAGLSDQPLLECEGGHRSRHASLGKYLFDCQVDVVMRHGEKYCVKATFRPLKSLGNQKLTVQIGGQDVEVGM